MKYITKILLFLFLFLLGINVSYAKTNRIELGDVIPNIRLHLKTPTIEKNKNIFKIVNRDTNELVYCIEPGVVLQNGSYTEYQDINSFPITLSSDDWEAISTIAYFGYQYQDRTDIKWYVITQVMIWEYLLKDKGEIYFIDENNQKISLFQEEKNMILKDIQAKDKIPSFAQKEYDGVPEYTIKLNDELVLDDENNVLDQYHVFSNNSLLKPIVTKQQISISANYPVTGDIILTYRKDVDTNQFPKLFYSASSQTVMSRGKISLPVSFTHIKVLYPSLEIKKTDADSSIPLAGVKYGIYYENGDLYDIVTTNQEGIAYLEEIYFDHYYLEEIEAPYGYELNDEKIYFEVKDEDIQLEIKNSKIKKTVVIEKYLETINGEYILEPNASFSIYNIATNELVMETKTNELGKISISLPYGTYRITQNSGADGYQFICDKTIVIDENYEEIPIVLRNKQIVGSLKIVKVDAFTKEPIQNVLFGLYDKDKNLLEKASTDLYGNILFDNLALGTYYVRELQNAEGYEISNEEISVDLIDSSEVILNIENRIKIEIPKTGTNELLYSLLLCSGLFIFGGYICNHEKKK